MDNSHILLYLQGGSKLASYSYTIGSVALFHATCDQNFRLYLLSTVF